MGNRILAALAALISAFALTSSMAVTAAAAASSDVKAAYLYPRADRFDTDLCPCTVPDDWDGTYFEHDAGGYAVKLYMFDGLELAGKVEFHPQDERVYVYDTLVDGVTITAEVAGKTYVPKNGYYDLEFAEGQYVMVKMIASEGTRTEAHATA
ncbi:hypothetical protein GCM10009830_01170 [Glycomyces endophyticus]|uniref:Secreted protein n=1 Tax=Glycomyces endophyticus TaxID=480996 RepID=A0ABP4RWC8_9ACTN